MGTILNGLVCALLGVVGSAAEGTAAARARDLTVSWLRWNYAGEILEEGSLPRLLSRAADAGYCTLLVQGYGHILTEHAGPAGGKAVSAFDALAGWAAGRDMILAGTPGRCLLVDLTRWQAAGRPDPDALSPVPFGAALSPHLLDLGPDMAGAGPFLGFLEEMGTKAGRGVFVLNYENYADVDDPSPDFPQPLSRLYCVAAGLKPNRILETHGFTADSHVLFFDYSQHALDFRRRLDETWDGRDYPAYLKREFARGSDTHFYLWPGVTPGQMDWAEMERLWQGELARWGGAELFAGHWRRYQAVGRDYLRCNILEPAALLDRIDDRPGAAIWWSNAFCTIYSALHHGLSGKRRLYEEWIDGLALRAPSLFLYGADHANMSVNGMTAVEYRDAYHRVGGDPLTARQLYRRTLRF